MEKSSIDVVEDDIFSLSSIARAKSKDMQGVLDGELGSHEFEEDRAEPRFPHGRPPGLRNVVGPDDVIDSLEYERRMDAEMEAEFQAKKDAQRERAKLQANAPTGIKGGGKKGRRKRESKKLQELFDKETTSSAQQYPVEHLSSSDER